MVSFITNYWWLVRVTLLVDWLFLPQNFGQWWGPTKAFCGSVNVHWVMVLFSGGGDDLTTIGGNQSFFVPGGGDPKT